MKITIARPLIGLLMLALGLPLACAGGVGLLTPQSKKLESLLALGVGLPLTIPGAIICWQENKKERARLEQDDDQLDC